MEPKNLDQNNVCEKRGTVLFVGHSMRWGGAEQVLLNILKHFHSRGYQVYLAAPRGPMLDLFRPYCSQFLDLIPGYIPLTFRPLAYLRALCATGINMIRLIHFVKGLYPMDVIFSNTSVIVHGGLTAKFFNIASVVMVHEQGRPASVYSKIYSLLLFLNQKVIVASRSMIPLFGKGANSGKVIRIPEGISLGKNNISEANSHVPEIFNSPKLKNAPLVGLVGNVLPVKGHAYFLKMAFHIAQVNPRARFAIIGKYEAKSYYFQKLNRLRRSLGLEQCVFFTGFIQNLEGGLACLDVLVVSSTSEGMPLVMLEAMALGKPVVAFNVGGLSDVILDGKTGKLVEFGDVDELAKSVQILLEDQEMASRMGEAGRRLVEKEFDVTQQCAKVEKVVDELVDLSIQSLVPARGA